MHEVSLARIDALSEPLQRDFQDRELLAHDFRSPRYGFSALVLAVLLYNCPLQICLLKGACIVSPHQ